MSYFFFVFYIFSFAQEENSFLVYTTHETTFTGLHTIKKHENKPHTVYVAPKVVFYHLDDVVVSFTPNTTLQVQNPVFSFLYVSSNTVFFAPENFVYLNNVVFDAMGIAQTTRNEQIVASHPSQKIGQMPISERWSQDRLPTMASAVGIINIFSKNATAIDAAHLKIIAIKKQKFGYNNKQNNFLLDIQYRNRPPPALAC